MHVGNKVRIVNPDYRGDLATITGFSKNLFGAKLVRVDLDETANLSEMRRYSVNLGIDLCFYPYELEKIEN